MNFEITAEQEMVRDTFARFLDDHSTTAQVRAAQTDSDGPSGFDPAAPGAEQIDFPRCLEVVAIDLFRQTAVARKQRAGQRYLARDSADLGRGQRGAFGHCQRGACAADARLRRGQIGRTGQRPGFEIVKHRIAQH